MKINKTWIVILVLGALSGAAGCNTISFFPHGAAEKAADKVLDDILPAEIAPGNRAQDGATKRPAPPEPRES
jgi:hypothetical protein